MAYSKPQIGRDVPSRFGIRMRPREKQKTQEQPLVGTSRLGLMLNVEHELVRLVEIINWASLVESLGFLCSEKTGHSGIPIRTMAGLGTAQHTPRLSDEQLVGKWPERPYWQSICGDEFFLHDLPLDGSQLSLWSKSIWEVGVEQPLKLTIEAWLRAKIGLPKQMQAVVVDTTVPPKAVESPTDSRLFRKVLHHLLRLTETTETNLRQTHRVLNQSAFPEHGRYMDTNRFKPAAKELKKLNDYAGRVLRIWNERSAMKAGRSTREP